MARAILFLAWCAAAFAQPAGRGVISGVVVDVTSGDPVRKAVVTVTWQGTPRAWATTRTDGSGHFVFEGLPAGKYDLRANKQGLGTAIYGASSVRELGDLIMLADGESHGNVKLRFIRSGSISGRVVDHDGDPVRIVNMVLQRAGRNLGERVLVNYRTQNTDDRGEYKIANVDPGEYYLLCNPNTPRQQGVVPKEMMAPQYYGGTRDAKDARVVSVRGGEVLSGFDFNLMSERPAKVTGHITGVPPLDPPDPVEPPVPGRVTSIRKGPLRQDRFVAIEISPADGNQMFWQSGAAAQGPEYHFELPEMMPGRYRVQANVHARDKNYYASEIVDAREGSNDVVLAMAPAVELKGHLKVEGAAARPPESFTVGLGALGNGPRRQNYSARVAKDGSFTIAEIPPGEWILNITPNPGAVFEKAVRLGDKDFLFKRIEIPAGLDAPLNIVLSWNTATVEGEIDAGGADAKRAGILLEPVGPLHTLSRFYYSAIADDTGKFKVNAVAPGKYKIFALEKIATANYRNPESGDLLGALGDELEVTEGAKVQAHPKLIGEERAKEILKP